jgi:hypothetical protein
LTDIHALGVITAARILALTGDLRRFPDQEHYASYTGTAPPSAFGMAHRTPATLLSNRPASDTSTMKIDRGKWRRI